MIGQAVTKKKIFEIVDDDGRPTDSRAPNTAVHGQISWNSELNRDLIAVLVTWKNEEDLIKNNKVNAWTPFSHYKSMGIFSNAQGQIWMNFELVRALMYVVVLCKYGKDLIKNRGDNAWTTFSPHKVYGDFFKRSRAANSAARGRIWLNLELNRDLVYVVVPSKYGKDPIVVPFLL